MAKDETHPLERNFEVQFKEITIASLLCSGENDPPKCLNERATVLWRSDFV